MEEIPDYLTRKDVLRNSKTSYRKTIGGREFFFNCTKSNRYITQVFDVETGILVIPIKNTPEFIEQWVESNIDRINERLSPYEYKEPNLFS